MPEEKSERCSGAEEVKSPAMFPFISNGYVPVFPEGICIGVRSGKKDKFILLRFFVREDKVTIPVGTYVMTREFANTLVDALGKALKSVEESAQKKESKENNG